MRVPQISRPVMPGYGILPHDVVVEGHAEIEQDIGLIGTSLEGMNVKYGTSYEPSFLDPGINVTIRITPEVVFGLTEEDPTGSPTRWTFD